ncbi:MAG TPA: hypothetical protein VFZ47_07595 [Chitinophagaceae bacterium]
MLSGKAVGLLLAGLAGYAAYKFSKMSPQQKKDMTDNLKNQGKKIFGRFMQETEPNAAPTGQHFGG